MVVRVIAAVSYQSLYSHCQAFLQHPDVKSAEENRNYVITRLLDALKTISLLADGVDPETLEYGVGPIGPGEIITAFTQFEVIKLERRFGIIMKGIFE